MKLPDIKIAAPYETLGPCRSRVVAGTVMVAVTVALIFLLSG